MGERITLDDIYRRFCEIWADGAPIVDEHEVAVAIEAQGLELEEVTDEWLRALDSEWVHFRAHAPFRDAALNRRYRALAAPEPHR